MLPMNVITERKFRAGVPFRHYNTWNESLVTTKDLNIDSFLIMIIKPELALLIYYLTQK